MKKLLLPFLMLLFPLFLSATKKVQVLNLKTEYKTNPIGISELHPRLSWELVSTEKNVRQIAWQIRAALSEKDLKSGKNLVWNSGKVVSEKSLNNTYEGRALKSRDKIFWQLKIFTNKGETSWSKVNSFEMGFLAETDWKASWIGLDKVFEGDTLAKHSRLAARYVRKEFQTANKAIKKATIYISGLGFYEAFINGTKTGDYVLAPAPTDYTKSVLYNTFDITEKLKPAANNAIAVILGNGRFFTTRYEGGGKMRHFGFPKMIAQIEILYKDGTVQTVISDSTWKITADGPIRANNEFDGEEYDARKELTGWKTPAYNDTNWLLAENVEPPTGKLLTQTNRNSRIMDIVQPKSITRLSTGVFVLDMGQNMVGWLQVNVRGNRGDTITLRFAESLKKNGQIYTANLRSAKATDTYICKGNAKETWEPTFVYHGFRYVEVSGNNDFCLNDFEGKVIYDDMETTGSFSSSDTTLNQIYNNAYWGIRGNYHGFPVDCPQRDERQGWLGDRTTGALGESFLFNNHGLYAKWLDDIEQSQRADGSIPDVAPIFWNWTGYTDNMTWPAAYLSVADMLHTQYGDLQPITRHYNSMKKWLFYMRSNYLKENIMTRDKYGDWCVPPESPKLIHTKDSTRMTDGTLLGTAYYYRMLFLMEKFARLQNKNEDATFFSSEKEIIKTAFNTKFFNLATNQYSNNTTTANLIPLVFNMVPEGHENAVFEQITRKITVDFKGHVSTGLIGIQWLMRGLTAFGRGDLALKIAANRDYPSWGYMIENGATTIWELWNGNTADPSMNSGNHVMLLGDLLVWYYQYLGGIQNAGGSIGYQQIELKPFFIKGLNYINASYHSPYGKIVSNWKKEGNTLLWNFTIPCNTTAKVYIPTSTGYECKEYGSGTYHITSFIQ
jgi:alpha-L-rhamnosidase